MKELQKGFMTSQKNDVHRSNHTNFFRYGCQDGCILFSIGDGVAMQINPETDLKPGEVERYWRREDLLMEWFMMCRKFLRRPIWMLKPVELEPEIQVTPEQRECIIRVAHKIWDDFKEKMHDHIAHKYKTSAFLAMVGTNIFLMSWDGIL